MNALHRRFRGRLRIRRTRTPASLAGRSFAAILVILMASSAAADVVLKFSLTISTTGAAALQQLAADPVDVDVGFFCTSTVTATLFAGDAGGTITSTQTRFCEGDTLDYQEDLRFTATTHMEAQIGLYSNTWSANEGDIEVCLGESLASGVATCVGNETELESTTTTPRYTALEALTSGDVYGPLLESQLTGVTDADFDLVLSLVYQNPTTGGQAFVEEEIIEVAIDQTDTF